MCHPYIRTLYVVSSVLGCLREWVQVQFSGMDLPQPNRKGIDGEGKKWWRAGRQAGRPAFRLGVRKFPSGLFCENFSVNREREDNEKKSKKKQKKTVIGRLVYDARFRRRIERGRT